MKKHLKTIVLVMAVVVIAVVALHNHVAAPTVKLPSATVVYSCNAGKSIIAAFYQGETTPATSSTTPPTPGGSVALAFSDGRSMTLAQTISADGGRYANADESFVFWGKGNGALVLEGGQEKSYVGCIVIAPVPAGSDLTQMYSNGTMGFSLRLPQDYIADESYHYQELGPGKDIAGVKFIIPASVATGTNLGTDTYVSVEEIPKASTCTAALFLERVKAHDVTDGQTAYSVATSTGAGAGNRYDEVVFALPETDPCVAVRYFIHYGVIENYPAGAVQPFDEPALLAEFDAIRRTLTIVQ